MTLLAPTKVRVPLKPPNGGGVMSDHVIPLPSRLERAAIKIKKAISKRNGPIQDWIDANIELAEALIEARHEFGDNDAAFGAWCRYNGLTKDVLAKNERVALIDMGANPKKMREVLQKTERRSIPLIYKHEWAFSHPASNLRSSKLPRPPPRCRSEYVVSSSVVVYLFIVSWLIGLLVL